MKIKFLTFVLIASVLFSCTKDDDEPESGLSYFKINDTEYELSQGAFMYYGNYEGVGVYNHAILLMSPEISVNWDQNDASGTGAILRLEFFNTQEDLDEGTYTFSTHAEALTQKLCDDVDRNGDGIINDDDCVYVLPQGESYISSEMSFYSGNADINSNYYETSPFFESGTIKIEKDGTAYTITIDCVGENGDKIKGVYTGTLHDMDLQED